MKGSARGTDHHRRRGVRPRIRRQDFDRIRDLLNPEIDFAGLTPSRHWQASSPFVVEQQAYLDAPDGRIAWMRVVCSGFRPL